MALALPWTMDHHPRLIGRLFEGVNGPEIDAGRVWYYQLGVAIAWRVQTLLLFERWRQSAEDTKEFSLNGKIRYKRGGTCFMCITHH